MENSKKLSYKSVVALGFLVYFFSYAMRLDFQASIVEIVPALKITETMASAALTGSTITYGVGQVICGIIGDKVSPTKMISVAMLGTILVNASVSFCSNIWLITALWCINGVCQAMIWPPLTRFISEQVGTEKYSNAVTVAGLSVSIGTIFVYLFVPVVLEYTIWRNVFRLMAALGIVMMVIWVYATRNVKMGKAVSVAKTKDNKNIPIFKFIIFAGLIPIFLAIALQGILRDGIMAWLPSLVESEFKLGKSSSILSAAILPVFSMICVLIANALNNKIKHEVKTAAIMFGLSLVSTVPLLLGIKAPMVAIVCMALISASMHGVNHMLIALIPKNFAKYGMVSTFSGILNACTYIGASIASTGFAMISGNSGWGSLYVIWFAVALLGTAICILKIKGWTKFLAK